MSPEPFVLHVLVRKTETGIEVHCLETDVLTEAPTQEEALSELADLIRLQFVVARRDKDLDNLLFPAPPEDWLALARARLVGSRLVDLSDAEVESDLPPIPVAATGLKLQEFAVDT